MGDSRSLAWSFLALAIVAEVTGTCFLKSAADEVRAAPVAGAVVCYAISFAALTVALRRLEVGTAYAVWSGSGTLLIAVLGMLWLGESVSSLKLASLAMVVAGIVGLQLCHR